MANYYMDIINVYAMCSDLLSKHFNGLPQIPLINYSTGINIYMNVL